MSKQTLPCKAQNGDPILFKVGKDHLSLTGHVDAVKFCNNGEVLYDISVYPNPEGWEKAFIRLEGVSSSLIYALD